MKKELFNKSVISVLVLSLMIATTAFAEEKTPKHTDTLDPVIVTAQRYQTKEVETPASVEVFDQEKIQSIGAKNVQEVLKYSTGTSYASMGPAGYGQGASSAASVTIRGVDSGTLVLVNGRPINNRGVVKLEKFPTANVERIEVIRGGGSVLYGSEALGGVINIITKNKAENSAYYEMGNYGQINTGMHLQEGKLGITYDYRKWGDINGVSLSSWRSTFNNNPSGRYLSYNFLGSLSNSLMLTYEFDEHLSLLYSYDRTRTSWDYKFIQGTSGGTNLAGQSRWLRHYTNRQHLAQLNYSNKNLKASLYYNDLALLIKGMDFRTTTGAVNTGANRFFNTSGDERNRNIGIDTQYDWDMGKTKYLVGATGQYEYYLQRKSSANPSIHRYNYSIYASADHDFTDKTKAILSARYSWQGGSPVGNLDKLTPQLQLSQKIGKDEYIYASAGMSYKLPHLNQQFAPAGSKLEGNKDLKPQTGYNYELGWKKNFNKHALRVALFHYNIKDKLDAKETATGSGIYRYDNEDLKNTGIEVEYAYNNNKGFNYSLGAAIGDPKSRYNGYSSAAAVRNSKWERSYDRYVLNAGVGYTTGSWSFDLYGKYLFGRVHAAGSSSAVGPERQNPAFYTTLNIRYQVDKRQEFYVRVENLLDRNDVANNNSTEYYYTPVNFIVGYNIKF